MLTRLDRVESFALSETMVPAANVSLAAQTAIERHLVQGRRKVRALVRSFLGWLAGPQGRLATAAETQRRFGILRLIFNLALTQLDLFADVMTQRSEREVGVWLSGLDVAAADALALPGYYRSPAVVCYLDRGLGAAIRRAHTRLPGGGSNPVAIVRIPRERMVGTGIGSSLVHEVGHQVSVLLGLVGSLRPVLRALQRGEGAAVPWTLWERWISEILSDLWSVGRLGVAATTGLMGVVSLPRAFVFRLHLDDPHPFPWIRVKLSCAMGQALYPHPQWERLSGLWESLYPADGLDAERRQLLARLSSSIPALVELLVEHRPRSLRGASLREVLRTEERQPARLAALYQAWRRAPLQMRAVAPTIALAAIGQARADRVMSPEEEGELVAKLLRYWALRSTLDAAALRAQLPGPAIAAPAT